MTEDGKKQRSFRVDGVEMCDGSCDVAITGMTFIAFKKGKHIRHYGLDDCLFEPAFEMINGKVSWLYDDVY